ncbi:recombinase family protein [Azorhizophilus paspali]|uniref:recombinase family protein n=1 Tax=Azorhizophilus paspali TaxID=69963 RepID=UPI003F49F22D
MVIWKLDRLGRSLKHLVELVGELAEHKVGLQSLNDPIDTTHAQGRLVFNLFASLAEFERELIRERTQAGLSAARVRGRVGGRPVLGGEINAPLSRRRPSRLAYGWPSSRCV